jgi:hypothetical protein
VPFVSTWSPDGGGSRTVGVGDIVGTVLLSPERAASGWYWGAGPVLIFPSATNRAIGGGQWGAGPSVGMMRQVGGWSITMAIAHPWSFSGDPRRPRLSTTLLEPIVAFTTSKGTSLGVDTAALYDWTARRWTVPVGFFASQIVEIGRRPLNFGLTARYAVTRPGDSPAWGLVLAVALLFPK